MNKLLSFSRAHLLIKNTKLHFFKDPIYGSINFSREQLWIYELINTLEFWRLNGLKQVSLIYWNFPSATHTRFVHSLGVYELCNRFIKSFIENGYLDREKDKFAINIALASALLHDVGHGALSHVLEFVIPRFSHEDMTLRIINSRETKINAILRKKALEDGLDENFYCDEITKVFTRRTTHKWIVSLISSDFDVDRLDYLIRDSVNSGVLYGNNMDIDLFAKWAVIKDEKLMFLDKVKNSLTHFLFSRKLMYEDLYGNSVGSEFEHLFVKACEEIKKNLKSCRGVYLYKRCGFLFDKKIEDWNIIEFLELNDDMFLSFIEEALLKQYRNKEARKLLGQIYGIWVDSKGNFCSFDSWKKLNYSLDVELKKRLNEKKLHNGKLKVKFLNTKTGVVSKLAL